MCVGYRWGIVVEENRASDDTATLRVHAGMALLVSSGQAGAERFFELSPTENRLKKGRQVAEDDPEKVSLRACGGCGQYVILKVKFFAAFVPIGISILKNSRNAFERVFQTAFVLSFGARSAGVFVFHSGAAVGCLNPCICLVLRLRRRSILACTCL